MKKKSSNMKSCAVIDLDSTLIHTFGVIDTWLFVVHEDRPRVKKRLFDIKVNGKFLWGTKRPYTEHFLDTCFEAFDLVIVWSAGIESYVHEVVAEIFSKSPNIIWTRKHCVEFHHTNEDVVYLQKPLSKLFDAFPEIDAKRTIIFDDYSTVCCQDALYHVHVPAWAGDFDTLVKSDSVLKYLSEWIQKDLKNQIDYKLVPNKGIFDGK